MEEMPAEKKKRGQSFHQIFQALIFIFQVDCIVVFLPVTLNSSLLIILALYIKKFGIFAL